MDKFSRFIYDARVSTIAHKLAGKPWTMKSLNTMTVDLDTLKQKWLKYILQKMN